MFASGVSDANAWIKNMIAHRYHKGNKSFIVRQHSKLTKNDGSISVLIGFHLSQFNKISANSNSEILLLSTIQLLHFFLLHFS